MGNIKNGRLKQLKMGTLKMETLTRIRVFLCLVAVIWPFLIVAVGTSHNKYLIKSLNCYCFLVKINILEYSSLLYLLRFLKYQQI